VPLVAREVGKILGIVVDETYLRKVKPTPNLKNIEDLRERLEILRGAFRVDQRYTGKVVLLFDDLYRTGATLAMAAGVVRWAGHVKAVLVLTLTKTRTRR
jgi:competence protein ComFC